MAESILVTGKKISSMELVTNVTGSEKIPTGQPDDLAVTPNQIADHTIARGDLASQEDLSQVEVSLSTQITDLASDVNSSNNSIRGLIAAEEAARTNADNALRSAMDEANSGLRSDLVEEVAARIAADELKVDKEGSVSSVAGRVGDVSLAPSDVLVDGFGSQEQVNRYVVKPFLTGEAYNLGDKVRLDGGDVVRSTLVNNTTDPNVDMAGWISESRSNLAIVSVRDFGARPENPAAKNNSAFRKAIDYMNSTYAESDGFLVDTPAKGCLIVPADGIYEVSDFFEIKGNYSLLLLGTVKYVGTELSGTVFTIGRQIAYDSIADNFYVLNCLTSNNKVNAFELKNMVDCKIQTLKIKGFKEALRCVARGGRGFFGNTFRLGTFDSNIIDLHIRAETSGAPNANRFYDGFFYKQRNMAVEQNCVKISSDGTYDDIDSNLFDGLNFEEGKATIEGAIDCIPINLEVGVHNRFINIRTENNSNTALARVNKRGNTIEFRAAFTTSTEIISSTVQQTLVVPQDKMQCVFSSGDLARESIKLATSGRVWNPNITFNDANIVNQNSTISTSALQLFDLTNAGIKFLNQRSMLSFKVKTNGDRRFLLRTFAESSAKRLNTAIACYDATGNRLSNDPAIAVGTWGVQQRIKSNDNVPLGYSATTPWGGSGAYLTPITTFQTRLPFEVHPSVAMIEVYYFWAGAASDNDITLSYFELYSIEGNTSVMDAAAPTPTTGDRWLYRPVRGALIFTLSASSAFDPPSLAASGSAGSSVVHSISVSGCSLGDIVSVSFSQDLQGVSLDAWVSSAGVVSVRFTNNTTTPVDLLSGVIGVLLHRIVN